jgi:hypothetical protein
MQEVEEVLNLCSAAGVRERGVPRTSIEVSNFDALSNTGTSRMLMLQHLEIYIREAQIRPESSCMSHHWRYVDILSLWIGPQAKT